MSNYKIISLAAIVALLLLVGPEAHAQQTTNTNCTVNGNIANCTSTTTDNAAQQQRAYEAGQQVGNALGMSIAAGMEAHRQTKWVKNYCATHPGQGWNWTRHSDGRVLSSGHCPTDEEKGIEVVNVFLSEHKDFIKCEANSQVLTAYLETNRLNPLEEKSYKRAYKDLKKSGKLQLYTK